MKHDRGSIPIDLARELIDEALALASKSANASLRAAYLEEKEAITSIEIVDIREKRLDALDAEWMDRLKVLAAIESLLARQPGLDNDIARCSLKLARAPEEERAYLVDPPSVAAETASGKPSLVVLLTAQTLLSAKKLGALMSTALVRARRLS